MTRYELHCLEWKNCQRCHYSKQRKRVVLGKGDLPCDVLFIGEAPGESEDVHGVPFFGQAGFVMDDIVERAIPKGMRVAFNNLTGCFPIDEDGEKGEPDDDCVKICSPRLKDFVAMADPKLIVTVGKLSKEWLDSTNKVHIPLPKIPQVSVVHPAAVLRAPFVQRGLMVQQAVVIIRKAVQAHVLKGG